MQYMSLVTNVRTCSKISRYYFCYLKYLGEYIYLKTYNKGIKKKKMAKAMFFIIVDDILFLAIMLSNI